MNSNRHKSPRASFPFNVNGIPSGWQEHSSSFFRTTIENNEHHGVEIIASSRAIAEEHASSSSKDITQDIDITFQSDNHKVPERNCVPASLATTQTSATAGFMRDLCCE
jgi:hypothetical protein